LPSNSFSAGFGSKVSTCDGPPCMNRKMTRFAFGLKCGGRTASGFFGSTGVSAAAADTPSRSARASRPKPLADRRNRSRRVCVGVKRK
jgi:hypothetical protein